MRNLTLSFAIVLSVLSTMALGKNCDPSSQVISLNGGDSATVAFTGIPATCANPSLALAFPPNNGGSVQFSGSNILVSDVPNDSDRTSQCGVTLSCDNGESCRRVIVLDITKFVTTGVPPTTTAAPVVVGTCSWTVAALSTPVSTSIVSTITNSDLSKCTLTNFQIDSSDMKGTVSLNSKGEIGYYASSTAEQVKKMVLVSCDGKQECNLPVWFEAYAPRPTQSPPVTVAPPPKPAACPGRYYYNAELRTELSANLAGHTSEPFCAGDRTFAKLRGTSRGALTTWPNGVFRYAPPTSNDDDSFSFEMRCDGQFVCIGEAFIFSRMVDHSDDTDAPTTAATNAPVSFSNSKYLSCRGSCIADSWANSPDPADQNTWDIGLTQSNGRSVGSLDVAWVDGSLNINAYGKIGRLSERFPTFEKITAPKGNTFNATSVLAQAAQSSLPFDALCLNNQENVGLGAEVWKDNGLGDRYRKGSSWFQKFGGVHDNCDTFADACKYAPLLSPSQTQVDAKGTWSVDVDNCDVTWKGRFPYSALVEQRKSDGSRVWSTSGDRTLQTTLYSEAVKPARWIDTSAGVLTQTQEYNLTVRLSQWVSVHKSESGSTGAHSPFTLDPQFFEYTTAEGDRAFGLNLLFYPEAIDNGVRTNFAADRRVHGFRVLKQRWVTPTAGADTGMDCTASAVDDQDALFVSSTMQAVKCPSGEPPVITLSKGPATASTDCESADGDKGENFIADRAGFSKAANCARTFQNLTLRGVATGKKSATNFEGDLQLQLLLSNGNRAIVNVSLSLFVSMLSTTGSSNDASVELCRASPYFPVYDPLGTSLPDARHRLASKLGFGEQPVLCIDQLDTDFGPEGWAVMGFDVSKEEKPVVRVEKFGLRYPGSNGDVMMVYNDATTGNPLTVPDSVGSFWADTHPFLNFRDITYRAKNQSITSPIGSVMKGADLAFAFMPGAINVEVDVDIFCVVAVLDSNGQVVSRPVLRRRIHVDPILTSQSRYGPDLVSDIQDEPLPDSPYFFFGFSGVVIALIAIAAIAVANDKVPLVIKKKRVQ